MGQRHPGGKQRAKGDGRGLSKLGGSSFHRNSAGSSVEGTVSATHSFVSTVDMVRILLVIQGMF